MIIALSIVFCRIHLCASEARLVAETLDVRPPKVTVVSGHVYMSTIEGLEFVHISHYLYI